MQRSVRMSVLQPLPGRIWTSPLILVVPPDREVSALQAMRSGATSYIVKTPRYTELLPAIVEEHIREAANRRRLAETEQTQAQTLTERNTAEQRLSQSQNRLRMILQQAPVLVWSTDKELRVTSAMGGGFRTLDTARNGERGLTLFEYFNIPDDDLEPIASHRRALAGEGVATQIDWQGRTYDVHIEPLRSPEGAILGTIGVAFDVSERMRTEETLRRSEERFRLLGRATNDVVWDWDLQTDGLWVNENVSKVFGFPPEEIEPTGAWWTEHLHPEDQERVVTSIDQLVRSGGSVWTSEYRFRRRDGTYATLVDRGYILHDSTGHPVRVIGSAMDVSQKRKTEAIQSAVYRISAAANSAKELPEVYGQIHKAVGVIVVQSYAEGVRFDEEDKRVLNFVAEQVAMAIDRKRAQERLLDAERLATMGQLAGFIAHELNTPLTTISLLTSAASKRVTDPVALGKLEKIDTERRRAARIVHGLVSLSKSRQIHPIETDLRSVVRSAVSQMPRKRKKGVTLEVEVGEKAAVTMVDPPLIQELLVHLLDNAMHSTAKGSVRVRVEERPHAFAVTVADTGSGMTPEVVAHLFEPVSATKVEGEGIGLGLLLAKHIATGHGGSLEVASEPGRGTTVTVLLPRREAA